MFGLFSSPGIFYFVLPCSTCATHNHLQENLPIGKIGCNQWRAGQGEMGSGKANRKGSGTYKGHHELTLKQAFLIHFVIQLITDWHLKKKIKKIKIKYSCNSLIPFAQEYKVLLKKKQTQTPTPPKKIQKNPI